MNTVVSEIANNIFLNAEDYTEDKEKIHIEELERNLESKDLMKSFLEYDYPSFKTALKSILSQIDFVGKHSESVKQEFQNLQIRYKQNEVKLKRVTSYLEDSDKNRKELVHENLKLKYEGYNQSLSIKPYETETPLIYIKSLLPIHYDSIINFFKLLNIHLRDKFNVNSTFIVIEDPTTLKLKKIEEGFSYVSDSGKYNLGLLGNNIITTNDYIKDLFNNFDKFSGIKDLFIVLDISNSTDTFIIGTGSYVVILNEKVNEGLYIHLNEVDKISENEIVSSVITSSDEFNTLFHTSRTEMFKRFENIALEVIAL